MKPATEYKEYLNLAKESATRRTAMLREENLIYQGMLPQYREDGSAWVDDDYASRSPTQSKYLSPDYPLAVDTYAESMIYNFPTFDFEANDRQWTKEEVDTLNGVFTKIAFANNLPFKMMNVVRSGIRKGFCACELVPTTVNADRQVKVNNVWQDDTVTTYTGVLDLIRYLPHQTFIDPNADPDDVRNTADYCIAYLGFFSQATFDAMAKKHGWENDKQKIKPISANTTTDDGGEEEEKNAEGVKRNDGIKVCKLFKSDGNVQVIVNDDWVVSDNINAKRIKRMPLIFYRSMPGGSTPYGPLLWMRMRPSVMALSVATNLVLDNIGRNLAGPTFHSIKELDGENMNDYENGELKYVKNMEEVELKKRFARIELPDMTTGAQFALGKFQEDVARISRLDSLSQGSQGRQQIRTDGIAEKLSQPSVSQKSAFVKQAEFSFFQEFGRDMLAILYAFYDDFADVKGKIAREKLADIRSVRVRQGSTLEEDAMSTVLKLQTAISMLLSSQEDGFSIDKFFTDYFKSIGITDPEWYQLPVDQLLMKGYIKAGFTPQEAAAKAQNDLKEVNAKRQAATVA